MEIKIPHKNSGEINRFLGDLIECKNAHFLSSYLEEKFCFLYIKPYHRIHYDFTMVNSDIVTNMQS